MTETQVLMTVSDFLRVFFKESFPGRGHHFSFGGGRGVVSQMGGFIFKGGGEGHHFPMEASRLMGVFLKKIV